MEEEVSTYKAEKVASMLVPLVCHAPYKLRNENYHPQFSIELVYKCKYILICVLMHLMLMLQIDSLTHTHTHTHAGMHTHTHNTCINACIHARIHTHTPSVGSTGDDWNKGVH